MHILLKIVLVKITENVFIIYNFILSTDDIISRHVMW